MPKREIRENTLFTPYGSRSYDDRVAARVRGRELKRGLGDGQRIEPGVAARVRGRELKPVLHLCHFPPLITVAARVRGRELKPVNNPLRFR